MYPLFSSVRVFVSLIIRQLKLNMQDGCIKLLFLTLILILRLVIALLHSQSRKCPQATQAALALQAALASEPVSDLV